MHGISLSLSLPLPTSPDVSTFLLLHRLLSFFLFSFSFLPSSTNLVWCTTESYSIYFSLIRFH